MPTLKEKLLVSCFKMKKDSLSRSCKKEDKLQGVEMKTASATSMQAKMKMKVWRLPLRCLRNKRDWTSKDFPLPLAVIIKQWWVILLGSKRYLRCRSGKKKKGNKNWKWNRNHNMKQQLLIVSTKQPWKERKKELWWTPRRHSSKLHWQCLSTPANSVTKRKVKKNGNSRWFWNSQRPKLIEKQNSSERMKNCSRSWPKWKKKRSKLKTHKDGASTENKSKRKPVMNSKIWPPTWQRPSPRSKSLIKLKAVRKKSRKMEDIKVQ